MSLKDKDVLAGIGYDKNGEADFLVSCIVSTLSFEEIDELRKMMVVMIGAFEEMWRNRPNQEQAVVQSAL
jgi:hypothetical protein